ncbi:MAG: hypothetical protein ACJ0KI_05580 [Dehalococcoidia bacterium]
MKTKICMVSLLICLIISCNSNQVGNSTDVASITSADVSATITQLDKLIKEAQDKTSTLSAVINEQTLEALDSHNQIYQQNPTEVSLIFLQNLLQSQKPKQSHYQKVLRPVHPHL